MDHSDRQELQVKLLTMTDSELLDRETALAQKRPCPIPEAVEYGMVMSELQRRTRGLKSEPAAAEQQDEVEAALAAAIAHFLRQTGKDHVILTDRELTGGWLEVTRTPGCWTFRLKNQED